MRAKAKTRRISIAQNELRLSGVCSPRIRNCGNCLHLSYAQPAFCLLLLLGEHSTLATLSAARARCEWKWNRGGSRISFSFRVDAVEVALDVDVDVAVDVVEVRVVVVVVAGAVAVAVAAVAAVDP